MARNAIGTLRAVKVVHRSSFQRAEHFEREFKGLLKFEPISRSHDGLVDVLQIGRRDDAGYFYYVMELADDAGERQQAEGTRQNEQRKVGTSASSRPLSSLEDYTPRTLRSELHRRTCLPPAECVSLGLKLASALEHMHAKGLVHRDIKPANIIFVKGEPKLADIGLVTAIDEAHSLVGTAGYIPPEGLGTPQADTFALGKVLYEIAFGKDRQEFPELPPDLESHPDYTALLELNEIILRACESDPRQRYASAVSLARDLALLQQGESVKEVHTRARRWKAARQLALVTLGLGLAGTTVTLVIRTTHVHIPKPEAARLYELGRWHYSQLTAEDHEQALKFLTEATRADPRFVQPYAELTSLYIWNLLPDMTTDQKRLERTKEIADRALTIDPESAEGHVALSVCHFLERDWQAAEIEIVRAIKRNPNLAIAHDIYTFYLATLQRFDEAHREARLAEALEPSESARVTAVIAAFPFIGERRFDEAIAQLERVLALDKKFDTGYVFLGLCYEGQSNYLKAIEAYEDAGVYSGLDSARRARWTATLEALRKAYEASSEKGYLQKWIELILADEHLPAKQRMFSDLSDWDLPGYYARLGENEKALDVLETHFDEPNVWQQVRFFPLHDPLRGEPRFKALVKRAGL